MKFYAHTQSTENMPTEPDKYDLLGFPGIQAEHHKKYIRALWLVAENDRKPHPNFLDSDVAELAKHVNKVVNMFAKDENKRYEELNGGAFLKKEAVHILEELGFGERIWGEHTGAEPRLKSNLPGERPRWGVNKDSRYESNDQDSIQLNLRYWMAARIQAQINASCKEKKRVPSVTAEHTTLLSPEIASPSRLQQSEHIEPIGSLGAPDLAPSLKRRRKNTPVVVGGSSTAGSSRSRSRARSGYSSDSDKSFPFVAYINTESEAGSPQSSIEPSKRRRTDIPQCRMHTLSPQQNPEVTFIVDVNLPNDTSTNIMISDAPNKNNNVDVNKDSLSEADQIKQKLKLDLARFLDSKPNYTGILHEVIPLMKQLYKQSPHLRHNSDSKLAFSDFEHILNHWENLLEWLTTSSVARSSFEDLLQRLADQANFENRVAMFHDSRPRSRMDFPLQDLAISLALFFEGLLGNAYMPFTFKVLANKLRAVNQSVYDTFHYNE